MKNLLIKVEPITELLERYIMAFLHPIQLHLSLRDERLAREQGKQADEQQNLLFLPGFPPTPKRGLIAELVEQEAEGPIDHFGLNLTEVLGISWMLRFVKAAYSFVFMYIGLSLYQSYMSTPDDGSGSVSIMGEAWQFKLRSVMIFTLLLELVFFPVMAWLMAKLWTTVISFFAQLFEVEGDTKAIAKQVVHISFTTHLFFIIPIFGELLHQIASWFYLFLGLKKNMQLSSLESMTILSIPTLALLFVVAFGIVWMLLMLQLSWQIFTF